MPYSEDLAAEQRIPSQEQRAALKRFEDLVFEIRCPLPTGAVVSRTYWRTGGLLAESYEFPWRPDSFPNGIR